MAPGGLSAGGKSSRPGTGSDVSSEISRSTSPKIALDDSVLLSANAIHGLDSRGGDSSDYDTVTSKTGLLHRKSKVKYGSTGGESFEPSHSLNRSITVVEEQQEKLHRNSQYSKMNTLEGVFVPTVLNVLSILMFLRFGFILGQTGILGMMVLLLASYGVNLLTTLSISAISTNGTVRGGGAYYMISRSLGPEFGGSIGVIFYIGQVLNRCVL
ncbi:Vhc1p [Sugiyamaella lignohabitans]|uniref:Vhc1p n=1 Tax=Sugiyamaella lignohabitans TaxID=796027 RepID=A0A167EDL0_9ASCO|nr:Vhc1p [Sugiyamaella lignohabitans]ANB13939.1 Vhc1p [Sugiyamaella lignohabitans]